MDKRALLLFFVLSLALFGVNAYFEYSYQDKVRAWEAQQQLKPSKEPQQTEEDKTNKTDAVKQPPFNSGESPTTAITSGSLADGKAVAASEAEKYYVLENSSLQLVFSSRGGALVEINLPLRDKEHPDSVVRPIEFDREMVERYPSNAYFPSHSYFSAPLTVNASSVEHKQGQLGGYYPLLRRDLIETNKKASRRVPAQFYATNIVSEYPEVAELSYKLKSFKADSITLEAVQPHRRITKTYTLGEKDLPYTFSLSIQIEGDNRGLWLTSGVPEVELISNAQAPALKYQITRQGAAEVRQLELPTDVSTYSQIQPDWLCDSNGFFGLILTPQGSLEGGFRTQYVSDDIVPSRLSLLDRTEAFPGYMELIPLKMGSGKLAFNLFSGPFSSDVLKGMDRHYAAVDAGSNPDYIGIQSSQGWFDMISGPFAKLLFIVMSFFYSITGSWGLAIILLTVAVRLMLYPLNAWSLRSSLKMQQIMPEITALQEKYKKDPKKAQVEMINLYRERGVNPVSGCVPLLIQLPFLIGMFDLLKTTFELRGACFIPGWIDNLAAPDVAYTFPFTLPFIGNQLHLLPLLSGLVMFIQQRSMSSSQDVATMSEKDRQQRTMGTIFSLMFVFMFYHFPSGINIYWISTSLLGIIQQWWMRRQMVKVPLKS